MWAQEHHTECLAQLATFPAGKESLLAADASGYRVIAALESVVNTGMSASSRELAGSALLALRLNQNHLLRGGVSSITGAAGEHDGSGGTRATGACTSNRPCAQQ